MIGLYHVVEDDLFDVAGRLRGIDSGYFVVYCYKLRRFEVHHRGQRGNTLAFIVPYDRLDNRTLLYARRTSRERAAKLIEEMERENQRLQKQQDKKIIEKVLGDAKL